MKILTRNKPQPIEDQLVDAVHKAEAENKEIIVITLDYKEWKEFQSFMRRTMMSATYEGDKTYRFMGVKVQPTKDARAQLEYEEKKELESPVLKDIFDRCTPGIFTFTPPPEPVEPEVRCVQIGDDIDPWTLPSGCYTAFWTGKRRQLERHKNDFYCLTDDPIQVWVKIPPPDVRHIKHWLFWPDKDQRFKP